MTYGSSNWHKQVGRANIEAEHRIATAEHNYERDLQAAKELVEGKPAKVETDEGTVTGFVSEVLESEGKATIENWNKSITVDARRVIQE